jgi:hypothetical protein
MLTGPVVAGESKFVFVPRADSPGHDYLRVDNSSIEECERRCDSQSECNAFTYNQIHKVCFLKVWANPQLTFYALAITGVKLSPSVRPNGLPGNGTSFIVLPRADSPGSDYSRIDHFSLEECQGSCEADEGCNAFTYNLARGVCFLKRAANQWTNFHAWAITGIKLSSPQPKEKAATAAPAQPQIAIPSEQAQAPQPTPPPQGATPPVHAIAPVQPEVVPQEEAQASESQNAPQVAEQPEASEPTAKSQPQTAPQATEQTDQIVQSKQWGSVFVTPKGYSVRGGTVSVELLMKNQSDQEQSISSLLHFQALSEEGDQGEMDLTGTHWMSACQIRLRVSHNFTVLN